MIINPWIFYWIDFLCNLEELLWLVSLVMILVTLATFFVWCDEKKYKSGFSSIWWKISAIIFLSCTLVTVAIPSKETMYSMLVSSYITTDNIETATDVIKDSVDYIFEKINGENND